MVHLKLTKNKKNSKMDSHLVFKLHYKIENVCSRHMNKDTWNAGSQQSNEKYSFFSRFVDGDDDDDDLEYTYSQRKN